jgi:hypothetical protein
MVVLKYQWSGIMFEAICTYLSSSIGNINKSTRMRSFSLEAKPHKRIEAAAGGYLTRRRV